MRKLLKSIRGRQFTTLFHFAVVFHHLFLYFYILFIANPSVYFDEHPYIRHMMKNMYRFYSTWNFIVQAVYFIICCICDVLTMKDSENLGERKIYFLWLKDYSFRTFTFPVGLSVCIIFWVFFWVDRTLIFPPEGDLVIPKWFNQGLHTTVGVAIFLEMVTSCHKYSRPDSGRLAFSGLTVFYLLYCVCLWGTYFYDGVWLYPFCENLSWLQIFALSTFLFYVLNLITYVCGEELSIKIWGKEQHQIQDEKQVEEKKMH